MKNCPAPDQLAISSPDMSKATSSEWFIYLFQHLIKTEMRERGREREKKDCVRHRSTKPHSDQRSVKIEHVRPHTRVKPGPWVWGRDVHATYSVHVSCVTRITWPRYPWCIISAAFPTETQVNTQIKTGSKTTTWTLRSESEEVENCKYEEPLNGALWLIVKLIQPFSSKMSKWRKTATHVPNVSLRRKVKRCDTKETQNINLVNTANACHVKTTGIQDYFIEGNFPSTIYMYGHFYVYI